MFGIKMRLLSILGVVTFTLGGANAALKTHFQLKKVMNITLAGSGGFINTTVTNYITNYLTTYLGSKYGFTVKTPANQAAVDSVFRDDSLSTYDVVIFNDGVRIGGTGAIGDTGAQHAFQRWLKAGGGLVGIRSLLDHNNTWPWLRDSVFSGTIFTQHSTWGASADANVKVQWDTLKTNGVLNSTKPEYDSIRACFPPLHNNFVYPDAWYSFSVNPRPTADILLSVDEASYTVPSGGAMGLGHPVAWAYHLTPDSYGNEGRFIYNQRGDQVGAWDGVSANHAPTAPAPVNGIVYSDTSTTLMTKGFFWQAMRWAAGLMQTPTAIVTMKTSQPGLLETRNNGGVLNVSVSGIGTRYVIELFDLSGHRLGKQAGEGNREYSFTNLKHSNVYLLRVASGNKSYSKRVLF